MTLETLAAIKRRPVVIAGQANFSAGRQQVNNGAPATPPAIPQTESRELPQGKNLEVENGERLDTRAPGAASGANQGLEAVGTFNGTTDGER
jgi:hypothetical protein